MERNSGTWYFCVDYGSSCYYKQTSGGDKPPERGWERASSGEGTPPTLAWGSGNRGGTAEPAKVEWDSAKHGKGTKVMRKSDGRTGVSTMDRDSDGDIKMKFDDDGEISSYIKTRDVWVLPAAKMCQRGHTLQATREYSGPYSSGARCDACSRSISVGEVRLNCRMCTYDLCPSCAQ